VVGKVGRAGSRVKASPQKLCLLSFFFAGGALDGMFLRPYRDERQEERTGVQPNSAHAGTSTLPILRFGGQRLSSPRQMMASRPYTTLHPESFCLAANGLLSVTNEHDRDSLALLKLKPRNVSFTCDTGAEGMKRAVSFFSSHLGQTGKATVQILPPEEKKVVSTCISLELHLRH
jgi:hypothetical protein